MKYAVSIYSFNQYLQKGFTPEDCIVKAKEMGFDAIEIVDFIFSGKDKFEYAKALKQKADEVGIQISNLAVGANLLSEDGVNQVLEYVDIASILGAPFMRHDMCSHEGLPHWQGYDNVLDTLAKATTRITEYAKEKGIKTMTENHGFFSQDSVRVEKLINTVANENFGQLIDLGNFLCVDEDPVTAVGRCAKYAFYVHAKDFIVKSGNGFNPGETFFMTRGGNYLRGTIIGHGEVPIVNCLRALKKANYDGFIAIEFEGVEDCIQGIRIGFNNLKRFCESI